MTEKLVVIGNGMAAGRALEHLFETAPGRYAVTVFGAEPRVNYNRILLSPVLSGEKTFEEIITHPASWYAEHGVTLVTGSEIIAIDRSAKTVTAKDGTVTPYDRLLIATGSSPLSFRCRGITFRVSSATAISMMSSACWRLRSAAGARWSLAAACSDWRRPPD